MILLLASACTYAVTEPRQVCKALRVRAITTDHGDTLGFLRDSVRVPCDAVSR